MNEQKENEDTKVILDHDVLKTLVFNLIFEACQIK